MDGTLQEALTWQACSTIGLHPSNMKTAAISLRWSAGAGLSHQGFCGGAERWPQADPWRDHEGSQAPT